MGFLGPIGILIVVAVVFFVLSVFAYLVLKTRYKKAGPDESVDCLRPAKDPG
jgi:hypothetical protein